jgi:putative spermidine/putrescine transport system substrate-binding protein
MKKLFFIGMTIWIMMLLGGCEVNYQISATGFKENDWALVEKSGSKTTVNLLVYEGDQIVLDWLNDSAKEALLTQYGIRLNVIQATFAEILANLRSDLALKKKQGAIDLIYLTQSEDFFQLKKEELLYGPFLGAVKAFALMGDQNALESTTLEGQLHNGFAVPVWKKSMYLIGNEDFLLDLPKNYEAFLDAIKNNPNTFAFSPDDELGSRFLRGFVLKRVGSKAILKAGSKAELKTVLDPAFAELNKVRKDMYMEGKTFPATDMAVDQLFIENKLAFSMSNQLEHVYDEQKKEAYPEGAKPLAVEGLLPYSPEFMVIPFNGGNKSGAILTLHTLLSPKLQASLLAQKGPGLTPVIHLDLLTDEEKSLISKATVKKTIPKAEDLIRGGIADLPQTKWPVILTLWKEYLVEHP